MKLPSRLLFRARHVVFASTLPASLFGAVPQAAGPLIESEGVFVIEPGAFVSAADDWTPSSSTPGHTGDGYVIWTPHAAVRAPDETNPLVVRVRPAGWGRYRLQLRAAPAPGAAAPPGAVWIRCLEADAFVLDGEGPARPLGRQWVEVPLAPSDDPWSWYPAGSGPAGVLFALRPGDFTFEIAGSSPGMLLDRMVLVHERDGPHAAALNLDRSASEIGSPLPWRMSTAWPAEKMADALLPPDAWRPFPRVGDRTAWNSLSAAQRASVINNAERWLDQPWPALSATLFLDYHRTGRRTAYQEVRTERLSRLAGWVMAECVENEGRFLDAITDAVWSVCEETWWGVPAHLGDPRGGLPLPARPIIDLFAPETASLLAWTSYLLDEPLDSVSPRLRQRVTAEIERRVLGPFLARDDWGWLGLPASWVNNHNTSINHHILASVLLMERDPARRAALAARVVRSLDAFLHSQAPDGGCEEGPGYWFRATGALLESLELLDSASSGRINLMRDPLVQSLARYLPAMQISATHYFNYGDAEAAQSISGPLIYRLGLRLDEPSVTALGAYIIAQGDGGASVAPSRSAAHLGRWLSAWFASEAPPAGPAPAPLPRDVWLPDTEIFVARTAAGSTAGFTLAALGGHNAQSHNHNDVGNFILYHDGTPVLIDVGREPYTAQSFDYSRRYEIWFTQSAWHNTPTVGGVMQRDGHLFRAREVRRAADDTHAELTLDLALAYPSTASLAAWNRTLRLDRGPQRVTVHEDYAFKPGTEADFELNLITPRNVKATAAGRLDFEAPGQSTVSLHYPADALRPELDQRPLDDPRLRETWGPTLTRVRLTALAPAPSGRLTLEFEPGP